MKKVKLKKKKWFKGFLKILHLFNCDDFTIAAFMNGAKKEKLFISLTPKEAVGELINIEETIENFYAEKTGGFVTLSGYKALIEVALTEADEEAYGKQEGKILKSILDRGGI